MTRAGFIPALRFHALTSLYDAIMAHFLKEEPFKQRLVAQAGLRPGHRVLDLGCGTGTLSLLLAQACPEGEVQAIDADPKALGIARAKAGKAGLEIRFHQGFGQELPFEDHRFDRVVSSLMFHHLPLSAKRAALKEVRRVLRPGGELHLADWGRAANRRQWWAFQMVRCLDGFETTRGHAEGVLLDLLVEAGFQQAESTHAEATDFGTLALYRGTSGG